MTSTEDLLVDGIDGIGLARSDNGEEIARSSEPSGLLVHSNVPNLILTARFLKITTPTK